MGGLVGYSLGDPADGHIFGYDAFATIQDGIGAVTTSTVNVEPGTCNENITINTSLTLQSTDEAAVTTTDGDGSTVVSISLYDNETVLFSGFTVTDGGNGIYADQVDYDCTLNIENSIISGNDYYGIEIGYVDESDVTISGNTVSNNSDYGEDGIDVNSGVDGVVDINNNTISGNGEDGIDIDESYGSVTIEDNNITGNGSGDTGIYLDDIYDGIVTVSDNSITGNDGDGIGIGYVGVGNDKAYAGSSVVADPSVVITCNTISENEDDGVDVNYQDHDYQVTVSDCNDIFDNDGDGVYNDSGYMVDATENWWGDASGPGGEGPGTGDEVNENVDYEPWLMAPCGERYVEVEEVPEPARFSHSNLSISPSETYPNQPVLISVSISNSGGTREGYRVSLNINGHVEQSKKITVGPHSSRRVSFTVWKSTPGTYDVSVAGTHGQFQVMAMPAVISPPPPSPPAVVTDTAGGLGTGGIIAIVVIGIMLIAGMIVAIRWT